MTQPLAWPAHSWFFSRRFRLQLLARSWKLGGWNSSVAREIRYRDCHFFLPLSTSFPFHPFLTVSLYKAKQPFSVEAD